MKNPIEEPVVPTDKYCLLGAGPAGLVMAKRLVEYNIPFEGFDRNPDIGGIWDIDHVGTPIYETAHFISSKTLSSFDDFPMPEDYPDYVGYKHVHAYLHAYATQFNLRRHYKFNTAITKAEPVTGSTDWVVTFGDGTRRQYLGFISACGCQWDPISPDIPGEFTGEIRHSVTYFSPKEFEGKRVLIVGGGNTACDVAVDAGTHGATAFISMRRGYYFIPKHIFGKPADVFGKEGPHLPIRIQQFIFTKILRLLQGDLTRFGLQKPDYKILEMHPVLNSQLIHALSHGDVSVKGDIKEFSDKDVVFQDGSREQIDLVLLCTGYHPSLSFVDDYIYRTGDMSNFYLNIFSRDHECFFMVANIESDGAGAPAWEMEATLVARVIKYRDRYPENIEAFDKLRLGPAPDLTGGIHYLKANRMSNYVNGDAFAREIKRATAKLGMD